MDVATGIKVITQNRNKETEKKIVWEAKEKKEQRHNLYRCDVEFKRYYNDNKSKRS